MNLGTMRTFIRDWLDLDEEDLPDTLLNPLLDDGAQRIVDHEAHWPWLREVWSFGVKGTETFVNLTTTNPYPNEITVLRSAAQGGYTLHYLELDDATRTDFSTSSQPYYWSQTNNKLHLFPAPTSADTLTAIGWRAVKSSWTVGGAGASPDMPADFHSLVRTWALAGAYAQQDDPEAATYWRQQFEELLRFKHSTVMRTPSAPPLILNDRQSPIASGSRGGRPTYVITAT